MIITIFVIAVVIVFGFCLTFANIHTFKSFKHDKDVFFLIVLISANIAYLFVYLPTGIAAIASLR